MQFDLEMFTKLTKHPNTVNARKRFGEIKKRVREQVFGGDVKATPNRRKRKADAEEPVTPATPTTPATPAKRARSAKTAAVAAVAAAAAAEAPKEDIKGESDEEEG